MAKTKRRNTLGRSRGGFRSKFHLVTEGQGVPPCGPNKGRPLSFGREACRLRSAIETCGGWLKECRRIATRFDKLALNFLAMLKLAIIPTLPANRVLGWSLGE